MINFDSKHKTFHLNNQLVSYLFSIEKGNLLSHLYYGPAIKEYHGERRYRSFNRGFAGNLPNSTDREFSKDDLLQEYSGNDTGDYRISPLIIRNQNGSQLTDFRYDSYRIIDGKPTLEGLPATYCVGDDDAQTLEIKMVDPLLNVDLFLNYTIFKDRPVITRSSRVVNNNSYTVTIEKAMSSQMDIPKSNQGYDLISLPGQPGMEHQIDRAPIRRGIFELASRRNSSSHFMNPFVAIADRDTTEFNGNVMGTLLVYSGNYAIQIEQDKIDQVRILTGINDHNFKWQLTSGSSFQTPEAIHVFSTQGLNGMSNAFHQLINDRLIHGVWQHRPRPVVINNWEATEFDFDNQKLDEFIDLAKPLGMELFVLDDGWFGHRNDDNSSLGDWFVNRDKIDLKAVADKVHQAGLMFGLWFEPEAISVDSLLYRKHPEWVIHEPNRGMSLSRNELLLDFSRSDVTDYIFERMSSIIQNNDVDYVKWDYNRNVSEPFSEALAAEQESEFGHRYILGLYALLQKLNDRFPEVLFEGCSGGGGRFDAGMIYYMPQTWASDDTDAADRIKIQYGTSLVYPISTMTGHVSVVPSGQTGRTVSFHTRGAVAMSSVFGYELNPSALTSAEKQQVLQQTKFYKDHRDLIQYGDFYRLESPFDNIYNAAWEFVSRDKSECLLFIFRLHHSNRHDIYNNKLRYLDPHKKYRDEASQQVYGGDELMNLGLLSDPNNKGDYLAEIHYFKAF